MFKLIKEKLVYFTIRAITFPFSLLSYSTLHRLASLITPFAFSLLARYRKRSLSNLSLAKDLHLDNAQIEEIAKKSLTNLLITALEYGKLGSDPHLEKLVYCENPEVAAAYIKEGKGAVFFCAHQANWELLFLEGTKRMPGMAIGRPVKNRFLYDWVLKIRERFGGKIIPPKNALKECLRSLKKGIFVGIVGDQGMPDSGFSSSFLGRKAWTSPLPALLAYRTGAPLFFALTVRKKGSYVITYSDPILADMEKPAEEEVPRMMNACLSLLENSIKKYPDQWLWQHNKWKQKLPGSLKKPFRHDSLAIILSPDVSEDFLSQISVFRTIYPDEWILVLSSTSKPLSNAERFDEVLYYSSEKELFIQHYGPKLVFNFSNVSSLKAHFLKLAAFTVVEMHDLEKLSGLTLNKTGFSTLLTQAISYAK